MSQSYEPPGWRPAAIDNERQIALIIYILYLVPVGVTHVIGVIMAYVARDSAPPWLATHYTYLIRTFWMGLLYFAIACVLCFLLIGLLLLPLVFVWFVVRCTVGLLRLMRGEAILRPQTWTI